MDRRPARDGGQHRPRRRQPLAVAGRRTARAGLRRNRPAANGNRPRPDAAAYDAVRPVFALGGLAGLCRQSSCEPMRRGAFGAHAGARTSAGSHPRCPGRPVSALAEEPGLDRIFGPAGRSAGAGQSPRQLSVAWPGLRTLPADYGKPGQTGLLGRGDPADAGRRLGGTTFLFSVCRGVDRHRRVDGTGAEHGRPFRGTPPGLGHRAVVRAAATRCPVAADDRRRGGPPAPRPACRAGNRRAIDPLAALARWRHRRHGLAAPGQWHRQLPGASSGPCRRDCARGQPRAGRARPQPADRHRRRTRRTGRAAAAVGRMGVAEAPAATRRTRRGGVGSGRPCNPGPAQPDRVPAVAHVFSRPAGHRCRRLRCRSTSRPAARAGRSDAWPAGMGGAYPRRIAARLQAAGDSPCAGQATRDAAAGPGRPVAHSADIAVVALGQHHGLRQSRSAARAPGRRTGRLPHRDEFCANGRKRGECRCIAMARG